MDKTDSEIMELIKSFNELIDVAHDGHIFHVSMKNIESKKRIIGFYVDENDDIHKIPSGSIYGEIIIDRLKNGLKTKEERQKERIDRIEDIRTTNNILWMQILRIAWGLSPKMTAQLFEQIRANDQGITEIAKEMCDEELH